MLDKDEKLCYNNKAVGREQDSKEQIQENLKKFEKRLDKRLKMWYNKQVACENRTGVKMFWHRQEITDSKKFEKVWKKDLTNSWKCDIMNKLFDWKAKTAAASWKLNNAKQGKKKETGNLVNSEIFWNFKIDFEKSDKTKKHSNCER